MVQTSQAPAGKNATATGTPAPAAAATAATSGSAGGAAQQVAVASIIAGKQSLTPSEYPVEAAVGDAISYNDLCSLNKGLQTVTKSLQASGDVGLNQFLADVQKFNQIEQMMQASGRQGQARQSIPPAATSPSATK